VFNRFRLDLSTSGSTLTIKVYYNGAYKFTATDGSPFAAGPVGMIGGYNLVYWDNVIAMTNTSPAQVVSYDDYDAWGMILEGRSAVNGDGRPRFKFTGKERDTESKYDYFGARLYDARVGRMLMCDPHSSSYLGLSPYAYVGNNPLAFVDPTGMDSTTAQKANTYPLVLPVLRPLIVSGVIGPFVMPIILVGVFATTFSGDNYVPYAPSTMGNESVDQGGVSDVTVSKSKHPEAAKHIEDAQAAGQPDVLTIDRADAKNRRAEAMKGHEGVKGKDRDEYPPAVTVEGGQGASVRPINAKDNRGAGSSLGKQIRKLPDGSKIKVTVKE
jgi:RHS repeat-associated protein